MRYLRIDDEIIDTADYESVDIDEDGNYHLYKKPRWSCGYYDHINADEVLAESDNLEEVCDLFVLENEIKDDSPCSYMDKKQFDTFKKSICEAMKTTHQKCYGAIYIQDKGVVFVAELQDSGELVRLKRKVAIYKD